MTKTATEAPVQGWEAGSARPKYEQIQGLAAALEVSADFLLGIAPKKRRAS